MRSGSNPRAAGACAGAAAGKVQFAAPSMIVQGSLFDRQLAALDQIEPSARILVFYGYDCGSITQKWKSDRLNSLSALAVVRKQAFVNTLWAFQGLHLVGVHYRAAEPYLRDPSQFVVSGRCIASGLAPRLDTALDQAPRAAFDYVWQTSLTAEERVHRPWLQTVWVGENAELFRIRH